MRGWQPKQWSEWLGSSRLLLLLLPVVLLLLQVAVPGSRLAGVHEVLQQVGAARLVGGAGGLPPRLRLGWTHWGVMCLCHWSRLGTGRAALVLLQLLQEGRWLGQLQQGPGAAPLHLGSSSC
jgi:hypothetical protein